MFPYLEAKAKKTVDISIMIDRETSASAAIFGPITTLAKDNLIALIQALPVTVPEVVPIAQGDQPA